jgi:hypothetical protein
MNTFTTSEFEVLLMIILCSFLLMNLQLKFLISYSEHFPFMDNIRKFKLHTFMLSNILQFGPNIDIL